MSHAPDSTAAPREHPDAKLLLWGDALDAATDLYWRLEDVLRDGSDRMAAVVEGAWTPVETLAERICAHPAMTLDGLRVKARALAVLGEEAANAVGDCAIRDVIRLLGRSPTRHGETQHASG